MGSQAASRSPSALDTPVAELRLAVWRCANTSPQSQRAGRYLPASTAHPAKMAPELARRILAAYSQPGQLVIDPLCGIGTTLVEAAALGRRAVGVELEPRWAEIARANLTHALTPPQTTLAEVREGDARVLPQVLADLAGTVDLVATSPPYACDIGMIDKPAWLAGRTLCRRDTLNYSPDHANLGHARGDRYLAELARVYAYLQHVVALLAAVRDGRLHARPSFWQLTQTRKARARGEPAHLVVHEDVLVFVRPPSSAPTPRTRAGHPGPSEPGPATPSDLWVARPRGSGRRDQG